MIDFIFYSEFKEICTDWYDWIEIWLRLSSGYTKKDMVEAFREMIGEVEEQMRERETDKILKSMSNEKEK